jgi:hypothetical protein
LAKLGNAINFYIHLSLQLFVMKLPYDSKTPLPAGKALEIESGHRRPHSRSLAFFVAASSRPRKQAAATRFFRGTTAAQFTSRAPARSHFICLRWLKKFSL